MSDNDDDDVEFPDDLFGPGNRQPARQRAGGGAAAQQLPPIQQRRREREDDLYQQEDADYNEHPDPGQPNNPPDDFAVENERTDAGDLRRQRRWVITAWMDHPLPRNAAGEYILPPPARPGGPRITAVVMQQELGRNPAIPGQQRYHWQMYIELNDQVTFLQLRVLLGWNNRKDRRGNRLFPHWMAPARGTQQQNIDYCSKDDTRVVGTSTVRLGQLAPPDAPGQWQDVMRHVARGENFEQLCANDSLVPIIARCAGGLQQVLATRNKSPAWRNVKVYVYWGPTGTGKSRAVYERFGHDNVYCRSKPKIPYGPVTYDGLYEHEVLFLDEYRETDATLSELLKITDGHPYRVDIKYKFGYAKWTTVIIASNQSYDDWYKNEDPASKAALDRRIPPENRIYFGNPQPEPSQRLSTPSTEAVLPISIRTTPSPSPTAPRKMSVPEMLARYLDPATAAEALQLI